ncbi:MAG TPA: hypothetical protein VKU60_12545 [Chloroflexota bacterium]|nr:hypothetical protein [Chloroflexota bacterium]
MKKRAQKLDLHRETLRSLEGKRQLGQVVGGYTGGGLHTCVSCGTCGIKTCTCP